MPSGRRTPSTLITSAPRAPSSCVATGPAQNAVKSVIRTSDSGSASASSVRGGSGRGGQCRRALSAPSAGGCLGGLVAIASLRYGTRGASTPSRDSTNTPRSTKWSSLGSISGDAMGATGIRKATATSTISWVVRLLVQAVTMSRNSSRRATRPAKDASSASPTRSARSIITRKSWNCCAVMVQKPTMPSAVGTIDGSSKLRSCSSESGPSTLADIADRPPMAITMASYVETSMTRPRPLREACRAVAAAAAAANVPASHSPSRPPACTGSSSGQPRPAIDPHSACRMNSLAATWFSA